MSFTKNRGSLVAALIAAAAGLGVGCDRDEPVAVAVTRVEAATTAPVAAAGPRVVFLGDSLTAGYGIDPSQAFPAVIAAQLREAGVAATVVNAGESGGTTAGGLRRLDFVLRQPPDVLVVCLGGNDGLRRQDVAGIESNLRQIVERGKAAGAEVLLLGMRMPTNYGPEYTKAFEAIYPKVAAETGVPLVPFALEGVGGIPALNQADGIHPTAAGQRVVAANVLGPVRELIAKRAVP